MTAPAGPDGRRSPGAIGVAAEDEVQCFLQQQGLRVVARNYRTRQGEIDLVCEESGRGGAVLVFVEVRRRTSSAFGSAAESITGRKRARIIAAARHYMVVNHVTQPCRFDCVLLDGKPARIEWLRDAFGE